jgi:(p)ppGpp synthase/HD superfamily hydrolase
MEPDVVLVARALNFAAQKHSLQRRKGEAGEPYINHLAEVALLLAEATRGGDPVLVAAGLLHDTVEDTGTRREELEEAFGAEVAAVVVEVTDDKSLPKARRKELQVETAGGKSRRAKLIKIADKTSNLRSIASSPPRGWDTERKREYVRWARAVVDKCRDESPELARLFDQACARAEAAAETER